MAENSVVRTIKEKYLEDVIKAMMSEFQYQNRMQVPRIEKVILNVGMGDASANSKALDAAASELALVVGQRAVVTKSKKAIAGFKLRKGVSVGCMVTLRKKRMYDFLDRLFHAALPRIRDFRGFSPKAFDGRGNYSLGIKEQLIFPEINYDDVNYVHGMNIVIVTSANTDDEGRSLLTHLGFPFRKQKEEKVG